MIPLGTEAEIRRLYFAEHWKKGTIVAQLDVHEDVVDRVIGHLGPAPRDRPPPEIVLDHYKSVVDDVLSKYPKLRATRIFDMLSARGYSGRARTLRRYVTAIRPVSTAEVFLRTERLPGAPAQI